MGRRGVDGCLFIDDSRTLGARLAVISPSKRASSLGWPGIRRAALAQKIVKNSIQSEAAALVVKSRPTHLFFFLGPFGPFPFLGARASLSSAVFFSFCSYFRSLFWMAARCGEVSRALMTAVKNALTAKGPQGSRLPLPSFVVLRPPFMLSANHPVV